jgi:hypothetical protein
MNFKKIFTGFVSITMLVSTLTCMSTTAFADETTATTEVTTTTTDTTTDDQSGTLIEGLLSYTIEDQTMSWVFHKDGMYTTMRFCNGVCTVDGDVISLDIMNDFDVQANKDEENVVFGWMDENPVEEIIFSDNVTQIDTQLFSTWYFYTASQISLGNSIQSISHDAFVGLKIKELVLPRNLQEIDYNAFIACSCLTNLLVLSENVNITNSGLGYLHKGVSLDNFVISGYIGSTAETYANENGFTFIALDDDSDTTTTTTDVTTTTTDTTTVATTTDSITTSNTTTTTISTDITTTDTDTATTADPITALTTTTTATPTDITTTDTDTATTTDSITTSSTTTTTTPADIQSTLPQTGCSDIYKVIAGLAALMTISGVVIIVKTKKETE